MKGLAILLVVLGHALQRDVPNFDQDIVFRSIYSFHMPLFMFLSGFIAYKRPIGMFGKFRVLVIPFISWYLVWYFVAGIYRSTALIDWVAHLYKPPDDRLWFLWILFLNYGVLWIALKIASVFCHSEASAGQGEGTLRRRILRSVRNDRIRILLGAVGSALPDIVVILAIVGTKLIPDEVNMLDLPLLKWYFLFFGLGYLVAGHKRRLAPWKQPLQLVAAIALPTLITSWFRLDEPAFTPALHQLLDAYDPRAVGVIVDLYRLAIPLSAITLALGLGPALRTFRVYEALCWLGLFTMEIYVSHQVFMFALGLDMGTGLVRIASASAFGLGLSLALAFAIKRVKPLNALFLGGRAKPA